MPRPYPSGRCRAIKLDRIAKAAPSRRGVEDQNIQLKNAGNRWCPDPGSTSQWVSHFPAFVPEVTPKVTHKPGMYPGLSHRGAVDGIRLGRGRLHRK